jgi:hypothetical protein
MHISRVLLLPPPHQHQQRLLAYRFGIIHVFGLDLLAAGRNEERNLQRRESLNHRFGRGLQVEFARDKSPRCICLSLDLQEATKRRGEIISARGIQMIFDF